MIRWTHKVKFLFLLPAVLWVLTFTIFPLGYSLFLAFHHVDRQVVITRCRLRQTICRAPSG